MLDPVPISALQHYLFCPRQCALIHVDGLWAENALTVEGQRLHRNVDRPGNRTCLDRSAYAIDDLAAPTTGSALATAVPLLSDRLGLTGKADAIEFPVRADGSPTGPPRPIEHKRGRPKRLDADRVQLCAQALCLEDMLGLPEGGITRGELFYHATRHRETIHFTTELRGKTRRTIAAVRDLISSNMVPRVAKAAKCRRCSLINFCLPAGTAPTRTPRLYLARSLAASLDEPGGDAIALPAEGPL